jgi:FecR protein
MTPRPEELIDALASGQLDDQQAARLSAELEQDPAQRRALARAWRVDRLLALNRLEDDLGERLVASLRFARPTEHATNDAFAARMRQALAARVRHFPTFWAAAALLAIALTGGWLLMKTARPEAGPVVATVVTANGARLLTADGQRLPLVGQVHAGDTVQTGQESAALAWVGEPTAVVVGPHSQLRLGLEAGGKRLHLAGGRVDAEVAPQPSDQPLVLSTSDATATVLGTSFSVSHDASGTRLDVGHGRVRLHGTSGEAVEVATGQSASASPRSPATLSATTRAPDGLRAGFDPPFVRGLEHLPGTSLLPVITAQSPLFTTEFSGVLHFTDRGPRPGPWHANSWLPNVRGVLELRDEPTTGQRAFCLRPTSGPHAIQAFFWPPLPLAAGRGWRLTLDYLTTPRLQARIAIGLENVRSLDLPLEPSRGTWQRIGCRIPAATQVRGFNLLLQIHGGGVDDALYFRDVRLVAEP